MDIKKELAKYIKQAMIDQEISVVGMADKYNVSRQYIYLVLNGNVAVLKMIKILEDLNHTFSMKLIKLDSGCKD